MYFVLLQQTPKVLNSYKQIPKSFIIKIPTLLPHHTTTFLWPIIFFPTTINFPTTTTPHTTTTSGTEASLPPPTTHKASDGRSSIPPWKQALWQGSMAELGSSNMELPAQLWSFHSNSVGAPTRWWEGEYIVFFCLFSVGSLCEL